MPPNAFSAMDIRTHVATLTPIFQNAHVVAYLLFFGTKTGTEKKCQPNSRPIARDQLRWLSSPKKMINTIGILKSTHHVQVVLGQNFSCAHCLDNETDGDDVVHRVVRVLDSNKKLVLQVDLKGYRPCHHLYFSGPSCPGACPRKCGPPPESRAGVENRKSGSSLLQGPWCPGPRSSIASREFIARDLSFSPNGAMERLGVINR